MPRIPLVSPDALTDEQRRVYERIVAGPRKGIVGPLRAALHIPELADRWAQFGELMRFRTAIPPRLSEIAILVTARRWNSQVEWHFHSQSGRKAGISEAAIEAIRQARPPVFDTPVETAVYEFARQLQELGDVSEDTYAHVWRELGVAGVVELTAVIGYYTMVSMTLNAHHIPVPDGAEAPLQPVANQAAAGSTKFSGLTVLAPACEPARSTDGEP
jgi:4-carboxymuconolactone decarboxylase